MGKEFSSVPITVTYFFFVAVFLQGKKLAKEIFSS